MSSKKIVFIVGPTAIGKSNIAMEIVQITPSQIISCDSTQVYKEITIASNKPSSDILARVPHHLINIISLKDQFDVSQFYRMSNQAIESIIKEGQLPLVVGGSGLYMKILLDGIFKGGEPDIKLREELKQEAEEFGNEYLYDRLISVDPMAAKKIHPNDVKKVIRALEVSMLLGRPISEKQQECEGIWGKYDITIIGLNCPRDLLYDHINKRVDMMFDAGLIEEIKKLDAMPLSPSAAGMIGIKEVQGYLKGEHDLDTAKNLMKQNTRRYAKRQLTWFRKEGRIQWLEFSSPRETGKIVNLIKETTGL
ncbi:MAG: tRNA (adenosine(37)-N6)-dimethylallyltransferase MiaA [Candidatus Omnitrophica bacterium]|nr:tRNA (adenosine(37)-N6)-dimethylallyltransferase MiaA [Candidatus Omnitrophota bacterium]